jgi:hypothetical protein
MDRNQTVECDAACVEVDVGIELRADHQAVLLAHDVLVEFQEGVPVAVDGRVALACV